MSEPVTVYNVVQTTQHIGVRIEGYTNEHTIFTNKEAALAFAEELVKNIIKEVDDEKDDTITQSEYDDWFTSLSDLEAKAENLGIDVISGFIEAKKQEIKEYMDKFVVVPDESKEEVVIDLTKGFKISDDGYDWAEHGVYIQELTMDQSKDPILRLKTDDW